jgi:hypothetical protein
MKERMVDNPRLGILLAPAARGIHLAVPTDPASINQRNLR